MCEGEPVQQGGLQDTMGHLQLQEPGGVRHHGAVQVGEHLHGVTYGVTGCPEPVSCYQPVIPLATSPHSLEL